MKNLKKERGITLVALIITIIVLLILAVVTISAVNEGSLFSHANNAATKYDKAARQENTMIFNYLTEVEKHVNNTTTNVWASRGITNLELNKGYYCSNTPNGAYRITFFNDGSAHVEWGTEELDWTADTISNGCTFTSNRMQEGDEYYIFNGNSIDVRLLYHGEPTDFTVVLEQ